MNNYDYNINEDFDFIFNSPRGKRVLDHLRTITIERVTNPDTPESQLRHLEGQRFIVHYIANKSIFNHSKI